MTHSEAMDEIRVWDLSSTITVGMVNAVLAAHSKGRREGLAAGRAEAAHSTVTGTRRFRLVVSVEDFWVLAEPTPDRISKIRRRCYRLDRRRRFLFWSSWETVARTPEREAAIFWADRLGITVPDHPE